MGPFRPIVDIEVTQQPSFMRCIHRRANVDHGDAFECFASSLMQLQSQEPNQLSPRLSFSQLSVSYCISRSLGLLPLYSSSNPVPRGAATALYELARNKATTPPQCAVSRHQCPTGAKQPERQDNATALYDAHKTMRAVFIIFMEWILLIQQ
jgi:hypothetical protein